MKFTLVFSVLLLVLVLTPAVEGQQLTHQIKLYELGDSVSTNRRFTSQQAAVVGARRILLSSQALAAGADARVIYFPTPDGQLLEVHRHFGENRVGNDFSWWGVVQDATGRQGQIVLTMKNGRMSGLIQTGKEVYQILPEGAHSHLLLDIEPALFPDCGGEVEPEAMFGDEESVYLKAPAASVKSASVKSTVTIDVLVVYTPQARDAAGGVGNIEATIQNAVDMTNAAFSNSNSMARLRLVQTALVPYNDTGEPSEDLFWVKSNSAVASLRRQSGADLVSLIVEDGNGYCGLGYVMRTPGADFASSAFQVTARGCAVGNLSYAHEHGHNLGLEHDPFNGIRPSLASYDWSYGYFIDGDYRTVMSYSSQCSMGCTRVAQFSNPDVIFSSGPTGVAGSQDNHRTLDEGFGGGTAAIAAAFMIEPIFFDGFESGNMNIWQ